MFQSKSYTGGAIISREKKLHIIEPLVEFLIFACHPGCPVLVFSKLSSAKKIMNNVPPRDLELTLLTIVAV